MNFLLGLIPAPFRLYAELACIALVASLVIGGVAWFSHHERNIGRAQVQTKWDAERVKLQGEVQAQQERNIELERKAELKYTVVAEVRDRFITKTVTEVRNATSSLAVCPVGPDALRMLNAASKCASEDRPASCGAGDEVR